MTPYEEAQVSQAYADKLVAHQIKVAKAETTREKICHIYKEVTNRKYVRPIETLAQIGEVVDAIGENIRKDHEYYMDYIRLRKSYEKKLFS